MKNKIAVIASNRSITLMKMDTKPIQHITTQEGSPNFLSIRKAVLDNDLDLAFDLADTKRKIEQNLKNSGFTLVEGVVKYGSYVLDTIVSNKLVRLIKEGASNLDSIRNYVDEILRNPSSSSAKELFDFLGYKELPITPEGNIIAWKGVRKDGYSVMGNTETVVLQGEVDSGGHINNRVGDTIEVDRICVDDNRNNTCSHGLHLGSYDYARSWGERLLLVEFNPADAVSVPQDCSCQKLRVCKYKILADMQDATEISDAILDTSKPIIQEEEGVTDKERIANETIEDLVDGGLDLLDTSDFNFVVRVVSCGVALEVSEIAKLVKAYAQKLIDDINDEVGKADDVVPEGLDATTKRKIDLHILGKNPNWVKMKAIQGALKQNGVTCQDIWSYVYNNLRYDTKFYNDVGFASNLSQRLVRVKN